MKNSCSNRIIFLLFFVFGFLGLKAQNELFSGKISPYITYESNYSKILNRQVQFSGYGLGLEWESGLSFGLTYYNLGTNFITSQFSPNGQNWQMEIKYLSFMAAYKFYDMNKFILVGELGNGFGNVNFRSINIQKNKYGLYTFEPTLHARYYVLKWLGLATQFGYRLSFPGGPPKVSEFSSFKFDIGFTIAPFAFYEALKSNTLID